jgi:phospholipase C
MRYERNRLKTLLCGAAALAMAPLLAHAAPAGENEGPTKPATKAEVAAAYAAAPHIATRAGVNDNYTATPIKHVIVIVGENRSFDHQFATYVAPSGDKVLNLLSEGIITADGKPGPNFKKAQQFQASQTGTYSPSPTLTGPYAHLPATNLNYTPAAPSVYSAPFTNVKVAGEFDYGLLKSDLVDATTGASGLPYQTLDTRIHNVRSLPNGPYPLSPGVSSDAYANSPVHRFYQMFQQLDCGAAYATAANPSGCRADLFPWVEVTVGAGTNGNAQPANFTDESTHEGATAMGFYNVQTGDSPYFTKLAKEYTILDNYHQPAKGGTGLDSLYVGFADTIWYSNGKGKPATPPANQIENPNSQSGTNNWWVQDGYSGGSYSNCSDASQPGVGPILNYLKAIHVPANCDAGHYYILNNLNPGYLGNGTLATAPGPYNQGPYTIPPTSQASIGDVLIANNVSWAYYGEGWDLFVANPNIYQDGAQYCNICNPFLYETKIMTGQDPMTGLPNAFLYMKDTLDLYNDIQSSTLPAVSFVKPSGLNDGHPESSKISLFEDFTKKIITEVQANPALAGNTAILITYDEGGGYWDSGYVQTVDFFGDGTRIPMIIVSPYTKGGHVSHVYSDHASIPKFIEANWGLPTISNRSRDNLPNPIQTGASPYVPVNGGPALSDLIGAFRFPPGTTSLKPAHQN